MFSAEKSGSVDEYERSEDERSPTPTSGSSKCVSYGRNVLVLYNPVPREKEKNDRRESKRVRNTPNCACAHSQIVFISSFGSLLRRANSLPFAGRVLRSHLRPRRHWYPRYSS